MAASLHKFLKKSSSLKLITTFKPSLQSPNPSIPPPFLHQSQFTDPKSLIPFWSSTNPHTDTSHQCPFRFYPTFSLGSFLNQTNPTVHNQLEEFDGVIEDKEDDAGKIWADSVKKKRKKKMNKHKYKKLRKRLRRKT